MPRLKYTIHEWGGGGGGERGGTPYDGLFGEAPAERGTLYRREVYKRVGTSRVEVYKRDGKTVIKRDIQNILNRGTQRLIHPSIFRGF